MCSFLSLENETVALAGYGNVRLQRRLYNYAKAAHKPTAMTLRLVDELFSKETLLRSTVHGTKEFAPLDQEIIAAIKGIYIYTHIPERGQYSIHIFVDWRTQHNIVVNS